MKLIYWLASALAAVMLFGLAACSEKPPGCADAEAISTAKDVIIGEARRRVTEKGIASLGDPDGTLSKFLDKATVNFTNIVDDGYDSTKHLQSCKAHIKVMPPEGNGLEGDAAYTTRRVLDAPGKFMLELEGADQFALVLEVAADHYRDAYAYLGSFSGPYACSGTGGAQDGPAGPFTQQVTMNVASSADSSRPRATLERVARGGGVETLSGGAYHEFELVGQGANTPDDRWTTRFTVTIDGNTAKGSGDIRGPDMSIVRRCTLNLSRRSAPAGTAAAPSPSAQNTGAAPAARTPSFTGDYAGTADSTVTASIGQTAADGSYSVSLETSAVGGCGGELKGTATRATSDTLSMSVARGDQHCGVALTMGPDGQITTKESKGCATFHGVACTFGGVTLQRTK